MIHSVSIQQRKRVTNFSKYIKKKKKHFSQSISQKLNSFKAHASGSNTSNTKQIIENK